MEIFSTTTQALASYQQAASDIQDFLDEQGFVTENPVDGEIIKQRIAEIIQQNIERNVNYARFVG